MDDFKVDDFIYTAFRYDFNSLTRDQVIKVLKHNKIAHNSTATKFRLVYLLDRAFVEKRHAALRYKPKELDLKIDPTQMTCAQIRHVLAFYGIAWDGAMPSKKSHVEWYRRSLPKMREMAETGHGTGVAQTEGSDADDSSSPTMQTASEGESDTGEL
ncbi:hypothetical protein LTR17_022046 [Elasticomyces elasticus]|nr:hypothetical protein LTR17_022046 [Elasticomyces elasticus]